MDATTHHLMTAEELVDLPDGYRYELVKGELLTMSPSGAKHGAVTMNLSARLATYIMDNQLGVAFGAETGFKLEHDPDTVLAPDIGFIRKERIGLLPNGFLEIAPDLAVEVISTTKTRRKAERKAAQWLSFGVQSVWLVSCQNRTVEVVSADGSRLQFSDADELADDAIVPGFRTSVSQIFD
jgi:Uma2 family endonuclease